jgi:hypothetical protein
MQVTEAKWELIAKGKLSLIGTRIVVIYTGGMAPYHVHRGDACHCMTDDLAEAKTLALGVVAELMEMGIDP